MAEWALIANGEVETVVYAEDLQDAIRAFEALGYSDFRWEDTPDDACAFELWKREKHPIADPTWEAVLLRCREYFDQRADADHNGFTYIPNEEMELLQLIDDELADKTGGC